MWDPARLQLKSEILITLATRRQGSVRRSVAESFQALSGQESLLSKILLPLTRKFYLVFSENTKSLNHNDSRDSECSNINMRGGRFSDFEDVCAKPPIQKLSHKSSETNLREAIANAEIKNISDLQKRLNNLKSKRLEFEKRKNGGSSKDESLERRKEEKLSSTQVFTNIKAFSSNVRLRPYRIFCN